MRNIALKSVLKIKGVLMTVIILCSLFISQNMYSRRHWNHNSIAFDYNKYEASIGMIAKFFDYEFGPWGEHGYLKWVNIYYSENGTHYKILFACNVKDQVQTSYSVIRMRNKLAGAKMVFKYGYFPEKGYIWPENTDFYAYFINHAATASLGIRWYLTTNIKIKSFLVIGIWHVNGLYCNDKIGVVYKLSPPMSLQTVIETDSETESKHKRIDQPENNTVKVFSEGENVVVKGADLGENIQVYSTSGTLVKSLVADDDVVNIKLPANEIYIVKLGQTHYKVAV